MKYVQNEREARDLVLELLEDATEETALVIFNALRTGGLSERDRALAAMDALPWLVGVLRRQVETPEQFA